MTETGVTACTELRDALVDLANALSEELAHEVNHSPKVLSAWDAAAALIEATCTGRAETPDPPEAPVWLGHEEASAWQGGWSAGFEAGLGRPRESDDA